jgi:hypothetical protein
VPVALYPTGHSYFSAAHWNALAGMATEGFQPHAAGHPVPAGGAGPTVFFSNHWWAAPFFAVAYFVSMASGSIPGREWCGFLCWASAA